MKRIVAFAALSLVVAMLLARIGALGEQIARLRNEVPAPEREVVVAPTVEIADTVAAVTPVAHGVMPAEPPAPAVLAPFSTAQDAEGPMVELEEHSLMAPLPVLRDLPVAAGTFLLAKPLDRYQQAGLTPLQRARVIEFERMRDAELEALRRRWDALIDAELTPEQRAKREDQQKQGITLNWEVPTQEQVEQP